MLVGMQQKSVKREKGALKREKKHHLVSLSRLHSETPAGLGRQGSWSTHHDVGNLGLNDVGALQLVEHGLGGVQSQCGVPVHQALLGPDVGPLVFVVERVPSRELQLVYENPLSRVD